jgi:hypothetical protein
MIRITLLAAVLAVSANTFAEEQYPPRIQAFLGSLQLDDQVAQWGDIGDEDAVVEFPSSLPSGGIEGEYPYGGGDTWRWGLNPGGSIGWKNSDTRVYGTIGGSGANIRFDIDNSLFIGELHLGGFVRAGLTPRLSVYASAGPLVMYGRHEVEDEDIENPEPSPTGEVVIQSSDESDFAFGLYGRAGIDFEYGDDQYLGFGVRYMAAEMDFSDTVGKVDLEGPQFVLTYTAEL